MTTESHRTHGDGAGLYLDDLQVGQRFASGTYVIEEAQIRAFAAEFDPQPFHLDESAAQASIFKGLAASGWHTAAIAMRLLVEGGLPFAHGIVGLGGEVAWPRPTRPGDTLRVESEIMEIRPSRSKPQQGIVTVRSTMLNQAGGAVYDDSEASGTAAVIVMSPGFLIVVGWQQAYQQVCRHQRAGSAR